MGAPRMQLMGVRKWRLGEGRNPGRSATQADGTGQGGPEDMRTTPLPDCSRIACRALGRRPSLPSQPSHPGLGNFVCHTVARTTAYHRALHSRWPLAMEGMRHGEVLQCPLLTLRPHMPAPDSTKTAVGPQRWGQCQVFVDHTLLGFFSP